MLDMVEMYSNRTSHSLNDELVVPAITFSRTFPGLFRPGKVASTRREGDGMHNSATLLPELLEAGKRLLVYAGNADGMCNFIVCRIPS